MADVINPVIEGEAVEASASPQKFSEIQEEAIKTRARSLGWSSKKDWQDEGKDVADWRPAREFVDRQSLFDKIRSVKDDNFHIKRENAELRKDLAIIRDYVKSMSEVEYKRAISDLNEQKAMAVQDADVAAVKRIDAEIDQIKDTRVEVKADVEVPAGPPPEFTSWVEKNKWYNEDSELRAQADEFGYGILAKNKGMPTEEVLRQVESKVKKMYPEKFGNSTKVSRTQAVEAGGVSNSGAGRKTKLSEGDLDETQKKAMSAFVARGVLTKEQYLDSLAKQMGMK
jgi:hypothetical protein